MKETLRLVAARGLAGTAVVDIEEAAGLAPGRGGFYRHFPSKEDALNAALAAEVARMQTRQADVPVAPDLKAELAGGVEWLKELGPLIAVVLRDGGALPETRRALRRIMSSGGATSGMTRVTQASRAAGRDAEATAVVVTMATIGFHLAGQFFGRSISGVDADRFVDALTAMLD